MARGVMERKNEVVSGRGGSHARSLSIMTVKMPWACRRSIGRPAAIAPRRLGRGFTCWPTIHSGTAMR